MKAEDERVTAWVTKYALTSGIERVEAEVRHGIASDMISWVSPETRLRTSAHGKDWHRTKEAALARAEEMRKAKIASMKKAIEKLEKLEFNIP